MLIFVVWCVFFCFCLLYVLIGYVGTPRFLQTKYVQKQKIQVDVSHIEKLLLNGSTSSYASHKDVELLTRHGLFRTLPLIKLYSPTKEELFECVRLQKKYEFTTYVIDSTFDETEFSSGFVFLHTSTTAPQILFALNRLKLVEQSQIKAAVLSKNNFVKTVCGGIKYEFCPKEIGCASAYSFFEYLPSNCNCCFVVKSVGYRTELENLYDGGKFYVFSNKKIQIKYEKIMKKLIFIISRNQLNGNLIIFISKNNLNKIENNANYSKTSWSTTDEKLNKRLIAAFENCNQNFYKKFNFIFEQNLQPNFTSIQEFIFFLKGGYIDMSNAQKLFVEQFLGVIVNRDRVNFCKPKLDEDYVLSIEYQNKKYLITRKKSDSNICQINIDGVCYRNFTSFCFGGISKPEIFIEY